MVSTTIGLGGRVCELNTCYMNEVPELAFVKLMGGLLAVVMHSKTVGGLAGLNCGSV